MMKRFRDVFSSKNNTNPYAHLPERANAHHANARNPVEERTSAGFRASGRRRPGRRGSVPRRVVVARYTWVAGE